MGRVVNGLEGVIAVETRLSHVDGERGELLIGGYRVEDLAPELSFEEVAFLLWQGRRPSALELRRTREQLVRQRSLPAACLRLLATAAAEQVPMMDALRMAAGVVNLENGPSDGAERGDEVPACAARLVAKFPTIVAAYARLRAGKEPVEPDRSLGHAANFLHMLDGCAPSRERARALETYINTIVDHGLNASTFAARVVASTRSDMVSAVVSGVGALKGPLHGGAPGPALDMLFELRCRAGEAGVSLREAAEVGLRERLDNGERIMGFGHRIYRVRDPRAAVLERAAALLFSGDADSKLYEDARVLEETALRVLRERKPGRRVETNVEFYTALLLHGIGLSSELFTPTFALGRVVGWTAHVMEQNELDRLIRPSSDYIGPRHSQLETVAAEAVLGAPRG